MTIYAYIVKLLFSEKTKIWKIFRGNRFSFKIENVKNYNVHLKIRVAYSVLHFCLNIIPLTLYEYVVYVLSFSVPYVAHGHFIF